MRKIAMALSACVLMAGVSAARAADPDDVVTRTLMSASGGSHLGVTLEDVHGDDVARLHLAQERGAIVESVAAGSAAEKAGLRKDDVVLSWDGEAVRSAAQLARLVRETPAGRAVKVEISRDGRTQALGAAVTREAGTRMAWNDFGHPGAPMAMPPIPPIPPMKGHLDDFMMRHVQGMPPRLGIRFQEVSGQLARYFKLGGERGLLVSDVDEDSPAARAGLRAGDVIAAVDGRPVESASDLFDRVSDARTGAVLHLSIVRDGKTMDVSVTLAGDPAEREPAAS